MADSETLTLLNSSKFILPIAAQRTFDIEVVLSPPTVELFDIEIVLIPPHRDNYDILIELVRELEIDETSYENFKKSDLTTSYNYISNYNKDSQTFDQSLIDGNLASIVNVSKLLGVPATSNLIELKKALQPSQFINFPLSDKFYVFKSDNLNLGVLSSNIYNPFFRVKAKIVSNTNDFSSNLIYTFAEFFDISSYEVKSFLYYLSQELNKRKQNAQDVELFIEFSFFTDRTITFSFDYNDAYFDLFYTGATGQGINSSEKTLVRKNQKLTLYSGLHNFVLRLKPEKFPISSLTDSSYSVYLNVKNENINTDYLSLNPFNLNSLQIVSLTKFSTFSFYDFFGKSHYSDLGLFLKFIDKELNLFANSLGLLLPARKYFFKSIEENPLLNTSSVDLSNETFLFYYKPQFANIVVDTKTEITFDKLLSTNPTLIEVDLYDASEDKKTITETRKTTYNLTIYNPDNEKVGTENYYSSDQVKRLLFSFHNFNYQEIKSYKENENFTGSVLNNSDNYLFDFLTNETTSIALNETEQNEYFFPTYNNSFLYSSSLWRVILSYLSTLSTQDNIDDETKTLIETVIERINTTTNDENESSYLLDETKLNEIFTDLQSAKNFLLNETGNENTTRFRNLRFHYEVAKPVSFSEGENVKIYETLLKLINSSKYGLKFDLHFSAHGDKYLSTDNYGSKLLTSSITSSVFIPTELINELTTIRAGLEIRDSSNDDKLVKRYYFTAKDYDYVSNNLISNYDFIDILRNRTKEFLQQFLSSLLNRNDNNTTTNNTFFDYIVDELSNKLKNLFTASIDIYSSNNYNSLNSFGFLISRQQLLNTLLVSEQNEFSISVSIKPRYKLFTQDLIKLLENNPNYYISSIFVEVDGFNNSAGTIPFVLNRITTSIDFHSYSPKVVSLFTSNKEKQSSSNTSTIDFSDVLIELYNKTKNKETTTGSNYNNLTAIIEVVNHLKNTAKLDYKTILKNLVPLQFYDKLVNDYKFLFTAGNLIFLDIEKTETQTIYRVFSNVINTNIVLYTNYFLS